MSRECFIPRKFQAKTIKLVEQINAVIDEYQSLGYTLTVRQLFYQLVARLIVENTQKSYKRVGSIVNDARLAGLIDWTAIEDRTRYLRQPNAWGSPSDAIATIAGAYQEDLWSGQDCRVEVWIEKDALIGVIERICDEYRLPYFACRGNNSQSEQYKAGVGRFREYLRLGIVPIVLHLGDHDPNGLDMTRDNRDRLTMFAAYRGPVEVRRLALNMDQVERYSLPPNPAKDTDSRFEAYVEEFGDECWELDALDPTAISDLIRAEVDNLIEPGPWAEAMAKEENNRALLDRTSENWAKVENFLRS